MRFSTTSNSKITIQDPSICTNCMKSTHPQTRHTCDDHKNWPDCDSPLRGSLGIFLPQAISSSWEPMNHF